MGNASLCCTYQRNKDLGENPPIPINDPNISYNQAFLGQQATHEVSPKCNNEEDFLNESSIIGITDFNSTSYINVNLQVMSRMKYLTDFMDIKIRFCKNSHALKSLKNIFNNLFKGFPCNAEIKNFISEIGHMDNENPNKLKINNDALKFHEFMLEYINKIINPEIPFHSESFISYNAANSAKDMSKLKEDIRSTFENEIKEMFYIGFTTSLPNSSCISCQTVLNKFSIFSLSYIDLSHIEKPQSIQACVEKEYYETQLVEIQCQNCQTKNSVKECSQVINYPKYLLVKLNLIDSLDIDSLLDLKFHKKKYSLSHIIFTQDRDENIKEYTIATKVNAVWYHCDNANNVSQLKEYLLNNCYILYYTRVESNIL